MADNLHYRNLVFTVETPGAPFDGQRYTARMDNLDFGFPLSSG